MKYRKNFCCTWCNHWSLKAKGLRLLVSWVCIWHLFSQRKKSITWKRFCSGIMMSAVSFFSSFPVQKFLKTTLQKHFLWLIWKRYEEQRFETVVRAFNAAFIWYRPTGWSRSLDNYYNNINNNANLWPSLWNCSNHSRHLIAVSNYITSHVFVGYLVEAFKWDYFFSINKLVSTLCFAAKCVMFIILSVLFADFLSCQSNSLWYDAR